MHRPQITFQSFGLAKSRATPSPHVQLCSFGSVHCQCLLRMEKLLLTWKTLQVACGQSTQLHPSLGPEDQASQAGSELRTSSEYRVKFLFLLISCCRAYLQHEKD